MCLESEARRSGPARVGRAREAPRPSGAAPEGPVLLCRSPSPFRAPSLGLTTTPLRFARTLSAGRPGPRSWRVLSPARARAALGGSPAAETATPRRPGRAWSLGAPRPGGAGASAAGTLRRGRTAGQRAERQSAARVTPAAGAPTSVIAPSPARQDSRRRAGLCACSHALPDEAGVRARPTREAPASFLAGSASPSPSRPSARRPTRAAGESGQSRAP